MVPFIRPQGSRGITPPGPSEARSEALNTPEIVHSPVRCDKRKRRAESPLQPPPAKQARTGERASTPPEPPTLQTLLPEIVLGIADCFDDIADFRALRQTSRRFDNILHDAPKSLHTRSLQNYLDDRTPQDMLCVLQDDRVHSTLSRVTHLTLSIRPESEDWCLDALCDALGTYAPNLESFELNFRQTTDDPPLDLTCIGSLRGLRRLEVGGFVDVDSLLLGLQGHPSLVGLTLCLPTFSSASASLLSGLSLRELALKRLVLPGPFSTAERVKKEALSEIARCTRLQSLHIDSCEGGDLSESLGQMAELRSLRLPDTNVADTQFTDHLKDLACLELGRIDHVTSLTSLRHSLRSLTLHGSDREATAISELTELEELHLWGLCDSSYRSLGSARPIPERGSVLSTAGLAHLHGFTKLRSLRLQNHGLPAGSIGVLLEKLPWLVDVDLSGNDISPQDIAPLARNGVTSLELRFCELGQSALACIGECRTLTYLDVSKNDLSALGFGFANGLTNLVHLEAMNCKLRAWPNETLGRLTQLKRFEALYNDFETVQSNNVVPESCVEEITLNGSTGLDVVMPHLSLLPNLRVLALIDTDLEQADVDNFQRPPGLQELYFG